MGNDPVNKIDPDGRNGRLVGVAVEEIALEVAFQALTGEEIDIKAAAKSAAENTVNPLKKVERVVKVVKTYYSRAQRLDRYKKMDGKCEYCGKKTQMEEPYKKDSAEGDHIDPVSKGGKTDADNQANACRECNQAKSDKEVGTEWQPPNPNERIQEKIEENINRK